MKKIFLIITISLMMINLEAETNILVLDIKRAVEIGIKNNYDILAKEIDLKIERNNWLIAKKGKGFKTALNLEYNVTQDYDTKRASMIALQQYLPTGGEIKLTGNLNQAKMDPLFYGTPADRTINYGIEFTHSFLTLNQYKLKRKKSYLQYQIAKLNFIDTKKIFIINVITAFYSIVSLIENIKTSEYTYNSAQKLYQLTEIKFNKGIIKDVNLLEAELQFTKKEIELEKLNLELKNKIADLKNLLRIRKKIKLNYKINDIKPPLFLKIIKRQKDKLVKQNITIIKEKYNLEFDKLAIEEAKKGNDIKITTSAKYQKLYKDSIGEQYPENLEEQWMIKFILQLPIFDWGINKKNIENAKLKKKKEYINLLKEQDRLRNDVDKKIRELYVKFTEIKLDQKSKECATKDLELKIEKYKRGIVNVDDVIRAQDNYLKAGYDLIASKIDFILAKINLYYLIDEKLKY